MSCPNHGDDACCPECPGHKSKDKRGFPHPAEAKGRTRLKQCAYCLEYVDSASWLHGAKMAPSFYGCIECHANLAGAGSPASGS